MSFEEGARAPGEGRTMQDSGTLAVLVCVSRTAVKPLTLGIELTKLTYAWVCRNYLLLFFTLFFLVIVLSFILFVIY